jgi:hypothetical protein
MAATTPTIRNQRQSQILKILASRAKLTQKKLKKIDPQMIEMNALIVQGWPIKYLTSPTTHGVKRRVDAVWSLPKPAKRHAKKCLSQGNGGLI